MTIPKEANVGEPMKYQLGFPSVGMLADEARRSGAGEAELAAIDRLRYGRAEAVDVERLTPLALLAGLDWWPDRIQPVHPLPARLAIGTDGRLRLEYESVGAKGTGGTKR